MDQRAWNLMGMEEYGYTDTHTGKINAVARALADEFRYRSDNEIDRSDFYDACEECGVDPGCFDYDDRQRILRKVNELI